MTPPNHAEWGYAIRVLERAAAELVDEGPAAAVLERVAAHMRHNAPPAPVMTSAKVRKLQRCPCAWCRP
jgi:hypothetical protein